jgi:hypothetical protein
MPSVTERERRFMGAELARKRAGKPTRTGMSEEQLRDFASKKAIPGSPASRGREHGRRLALAAYSRRKGASAAHRSTAARKSAHAGRK